MRSVALPITFNWSIGFVAAGVSNLMALALCFGQHRAERALHQQQFEGVVVGGSSTGEHVRSHRLRTARHFGLGGLNAPRVMRYTAQCYAASAVALDDRG